MAYIYMVTPFYLTFFSGMYFGILSDILSGILFGIYSNILSGILFGLHSEILFGVLSEILSGMCSGPCVPSLIWSSADRVQVCACPDSHGACNKSRVRLPPHSDAELAQGGGKRKKEGRRKEEGRKKEGKSYLSLKSRDHHLAGGEFQQPPPNFPEIAGMHELYPK